MTPIRRAALLWGLVGALAFLVLIQGYELLTDESVTIGVKAGVAVLVGIGAAASTYGLRDRLPVR